VPFDPQSGVVDLIMGLAALATLVTVVRARRTFLDRDFTAADKRLATQAAVFLVPPVVVLIHELGHAAAVLAIGARITDFHYGFFEGAVGFAGDITPGQDWFVSVAGNLAGALTGLVLAAAGLAAARMRPGLRYVLILGGILQVAYALVGYPLLSLSSNWGDWVVIYDFGATPGLSWATAVVHAAALAGLWRWWRGTVRHDLFAVGSADGDRVAALRRSVRETPADEARWLELAGLYARSGELALARATLDEAAGAAPSARVHLARVRVAIMESRWSSAVIAAEEGVKAAGPDDVDLVQRLWANQGLALASMERPTHALAAFDRLGPPVVDDARVRYGRGLARLGAGDPEGGRSDLEAVVQCLPAGNLLGLWAAARLAGRLPDPPDDSDRPNYLRRSAPPPAPLAGL
jgi:tetratricopeptide (TPR) repeat protein